MIATLKRRKADTVSETGLDCHRRRGNFYKPVSTNTEDPRCIMVDMNDSVIDTRELFVPLADKFIELLSGLTENDWQRKGPYPRWTVRDIVSHMIQSAASRLSKQRDRYGRNEGKNGPDFETLTSIIGEENDLWEDATKGFSPRLLRDIISITEYQLAELCAAAKLDDPALFAVTWAGEESSAMWFDVAREYTERWHHQQQIREAVGAEGIMSPRWLSPVIETLLRGLPYWFTRHDDISAQEVVIEVTGPSGGIWTLRKRKQSWQLERETEAGQDLIRVADDVIWRHLMRSGPRGGASERIDFACSDAVKRAFLDSRAIMMS